MPIVDRSSRLVPANARNSDVARRLLEEVTPLQQARQLAAHRVQGIEALLYSGLHSGRQCPCMTANTDVAKLSPDGKASPGAINRVLSGNSNFGISPYDPRTPLADPNVADDQGQVSPMDELKDWFGVENRVQDRANQIETVPTVGDDGQFSPDLDDMFGDIDMSQLGISDVSCPICFGTHYVGGYSPFRSWRQVLIAKDFATNSYFDLPTMNLTPGQHTAQITLPKGAIKLESFTAYNGALQAKATLALDGTTITPSNVLTFCDGLPHTLAITSTDPFTHFEAQFAMSAEPIYFEIPKLMRNADISLLEQQEPFQIVVSPDVPHMHSLDIIAESQLGKILVVTSVNPWNTRTRQMLGWECQVRVAQPQELWRILPFRPPITGQKTVRSATVPNRSKVTSGLGLKEFKF